MSSYLVYPDNSCDFSKYTLTDLMVFFCLDVQLERVKEGGGVRLQKKEGRRKNAPSLAFHNFRKRLSPDKCALCTLILLSCFLVFDLELTAYFSQVFFSFSAGIPQSL